jgi:glutamine amidotransferase
MTQIVIIDYGMANLRSVQKGFEAVGANAVISDDAATIADADKLVLPGVGAFPDAMARFRENGLDKVITDFCHSGRPFLGICLGMQMLFDRSFEDRPCDGLGLFAGESVRFPVVSGLKVPHMGWNTLRHLRPDCPLLIGVPQDASVYFVHSYYVKSADPAIVASEADYPDPIPAVIWRDHIFAAQFHPEKSQAIGLQMLRNFANL